LLQFNCSGLRSSAAELCDFLEKQRISVAALQETKLNDKSVPPKFPNYNLVRRDRPGGGGRGLAYLVHHSFPFLPLVSPLSNDPVVECQGIPAPLNGINLEIYNLYIPPASGCPRGHKPDLSSILNLPNDVLIVGDLNAHHPSWDFSLSDIRGDALADAIDSSPLLVLNKDSATRIPSARNQPESSPDVSLALAHLALEFT
jgi:exonuclease III